MCEWHRQWSRPSVVAEKTHGLLLKGAVCLSERRLDKFVLVCEHLLKLPLEQSLPMRPGRICSCLHTAWAVIPEVPLNFLLSESSAALKLRIHRGWREKRHEIMSRDSPSIVQISSVTYIYTHFFFSIIVRHSGAGRLLLFFLCYGAQGRSSWLSNFASQCFCQRCCRWKIRLFHTVPRFNTLCFSQKNVTNNLQFSPKCHGGERKIQNQNIFCVLLRSDICVLT